MFTEVSDNVVESEQGKKLITKLAMLKQKIANREMEIIGSNEQEKQASAGRILDKLLEIDNKLPS